MPNPVRVLCVGSGPESLAGALEGHFGAITATTVETPEQGLESLADANCVLSGLEPTGPTSMDGLDFLDAVRDHHPSIPFVLVVPPTEVERVSEAIDAGVTDFHVRSQAATEEEIDAARLANRIELVVDRAEDDGGDRDDENDTADVSPPHGRRQAPTVLDSDRTRPFVERIGDPMYVLDAEGTCVVVNEALLEYTGYDREAVEGRPVSELVDDDEFETAERTLECLYRDDERNRDAFEVTVETAGDATRVGEVHVTVVTDETGSFAGSVGIIRDITDRKERIRELGQYEAIVETAPIGLLVVDADGQIRWHNEEFTEDLGISDRDLEGADFADLVTEGFFPDATLENYLDRVRHLLSSDTDDERVTYEERWVDADGERGISEVNMGLLPLEEGEFVGTVNAFRNVTERIQYREELERQNDRLEKFASLVSHDLRNPLNVAQGHLDLLETEYDDEAIDETRWAVNRMEELIDDLLALARYGRTVADRESIELAELAEVAWTGVDTADASLVVDLEGTVSAHEGRVRELFENLFRNAVEHGGDDVTVTVGALNATDPDGGFFVEDDGSGLPDTDAIFEFGHTTATDGTGFGLSIVSEIADAHGWRVSATEGSAGGARFEIRGVSVRGEPAAN